LQLFLHFTLVYLRNRFRNPVPPNLLDNDNQQAKVSDRISPVLPSVVILWLPTVHQAPHEEQSKSVEVLVQSPVAIMKIAGPSFESIRNEAVGRVADGVNEEQAVPEEAEVKRKGNGSGVVVDLAEGEADKLAKEKDSVVVTLEKADGVLDRFDQLFVGLRFGSPSCHFSNV
ncbi:hypothetical protein BJ508DRAFT_340540, partial [Ascobolus immersus RN42]